MFSLPEDRVSNYASKDDGWCDDDDDDGSPSQLVYSVMKRTSLT